MTRRGLVNHSPFSPRRRPYFGLLLAIIHHP
jgi:hypothetical protein